MSRLQIRIIGYRILAMAETLVDLAAQIGENGYSVPFVVDCPENDNLCVGKFHCSDLCPKAKAAHEAYSLWVTRPTTKNNGEHGMLTTCHEGSFETIEGHVEHYVSQSPLEH